MKEPIGKCISNLEVASGLKLKQVTAPIGVVLVVFESRPDSLPQIASLALRSGNGLLLKGGKEAEHSNACLHRVIVNAVHTASGGKVPREVIGLVMGRAAVGELLKLDELIDLVIPRGSNSLVMNIKANTRIPVLGHAEGICHVYVDSEADSEKAADIVVDSKTNYPAACNAAETLLLHESLLADPAGCASYLLRRLQTASVTVMGGPRAVEVGFIPAAAAADGFKNEYGDNTITVELVPSLEAAIEHIHNYGSGHTETIVTENAASAQRFLEAVDSACVFHNSSTRFSDGFRFGLGAEVGISTGRIHARGPVGVEGLLTTKWVLRSDTCHVVGKMNGNEMPYTHVPIELEDGI
jgi:gamma-glutamyl phosphate reductase